MRHLEAFWTRFIRYVGNCITIVVLAAAAKTQCQCQKKQLLHHWTISYFVIKIQYLLPIVKVEMFPNKVTSKELFKNSFSCNFLSHYTYSEFRTIVFFPMCFFSLNFMFMKKKRKTGF